MDANELLAEASQKVNFTTLSRSRGLADPKLKARFAALGGGVFASSPADFGTFIGDDTEKMGQVLRFSGAKPG